MFNGLFLLYHRILLIFNNVHKCLVYPLWRNKCESRSAVGDRMNKHKFECIHGPNEQYVRCVLYLLSVTVSVKHVLWLHFRINTSAHEQLSQEDWRTHILFTAVEDWDLHWHVRPRESRSEGCREKYGVVWKLLYCTVKVKTWS